MNTNMTEMPELAPLKQEVVDLLVDLAPRGWKRIFCDFEVQDRPDCYVSSEVTIAVVKPLFGDPQAVEIDVGQNGLIGTKMREIAKALLAVQRVPHVTIDLFVTSPESHTWQFDFSAPARVTAMLAGDLEAEYRVPEMRKPYLKFAGQDEWLGRIAAGES